MILDINGNIINSASHTINSNQEATMTTKQQITCAKRAAQWLASVVVGLAQRVWNAVKAFFTALFTSK